MAPATAAAQAALRPEVFFVSQPAPYAPASSTGAAREGSSPVGTGPARPQVQAPPITPQTVARTEMRNGLVALVKETRGTGLIAGHGDVKAGAMSVGGRSGPARF